MDLASLHRERDLAATCTACPLCEERTQVVWGSGNERARVMLIGEGPGKNEDRGGAPFIGAAGRLLDEVLEHAGLVREDLYITNVVKCRPPANRTPKDAEVAVCERWVLAEIEGVDPQVVVTLGNVATHWMLQTGEGITTLRGRVFDVGGRFVIPTYHPAAAIYDSTKRTPLFEDARRIRGLVS